MLVTVNH